MLYPMLAKEAKTDTIEHFITDDSWVMEQKLDGHRILLQSPGGNYPPTALTRNGTPYTRRLPKALQDFRFPEGNEAGQFILDGELVGNTFWVFDMLVANMTTVHTPLKVRRFALEQTFEFWSLGNSAIRLVPQARTKDDKIKLASTALANNYEGLVCKRADSVYVSGGRTDDWLKVKFVSTVDCVVLDVRDDGKESVRLGMYDDSDNIVDVGRASLIGKEKEGVIGVGEILELRYLYAGANGRLYQPTIMKRRDDKYPSECRLSSLKHVNKEVLETL